MLPIGRGDRFEEKTVIDGDSQEEESVDMQLVDLINSGVFTAYDKIVQRKVKQ